MQSAIYTGRVFHERHGAVRHRLAYDVFYLLLDLDELPQLDGETRWFATNRRAFFSYHDADHGSTPAAGRPFAATLRDALASAGLMAHDWSFRVLTMPRVLGYLFNPISVVYCYDPDTRLRAMVYEVNNTFGERMTYVMPVSRPADRLHQRCDKALFVSPFFDLAGHYEFSLSEPGPRLDLRIDYFDSDELRLRASFTGRRQPFSAGVLAGLAWRYPAATLKVAAAIHFEALKLWLKRVPLVRHVRAGNRTIAIGTEQ